MFSQPEITERRRENSYGVWWMTHSRGRCDGEREGGRCGADEGCVWKRWVKKKRYIVRSSQCLSTHDNDVGQRVFLNAPSVVSGCRNDDRFILSHKLHFSRRGIFCQNTFLNETSSWALSEHQFVWLNIRLTSHSGNNPLHDKWWCVSVLLNVIS